MRIDNCNKMFVLHTGVWFDESDQVDSGINKISLQNTGCKLLQECRCAKLMTVAKIINQVLPLVI